MADAQGIRANMTEKAPKLTIRAMRAVLGFIQTESASGKLLMAAALLAVVAANSAAADAYESLKALMIGPKPLILWVNDALMAIFFLLVGLEIKREFKDGQFADRRNALLPLIAALGGMICPALIYSAINWGDAAALRGWAIASATDIAFALGVLVLLGSRVPPGLKVLLTAIAVLDDLGAIIIIALFYAEGLAVNALFAAALIFGLMLFLNLRGWASLPILLPLGALLWLAILKSGVHPTIAGVLTGLLVPMENRRGVPVLSRMEHALHPWVAFGIMPLFAFLNAGLSLAGLQPSALLGAVPLGISLGLLLGKTAGIFGSIMLAVRARLAPLPDRCDARHILGMAMLSGIGFTMSLFIGGLAFADEATQNLVRLGVLCGSVASALLGLLWLKGSLPAQQDRSIA